MNGEAGEGGRVWAEAHGNSPVAIRGHRPCGRRVRGQRRGAGGRALGWNELEGEPRELRQAHPGLSDDSGDFPCRTRAEEGRRAVA